MPGTDDVVGRTLKLNGRDFTIIGVAPRGFGGSMVLVSPELWLPTGVYDSLANDFVRDDSAGTMKERRHHTLVLVGRFKPGGTMATVTPALQAAGVKVAPSPAEMGVTLKSML